MAPQEFDERNYGKSISKIRIPASFHERENFKAAALVLVNAAVVLLSGVAAWRWHSVPGYVLAFVLVAARGQALYILQHECMHYLLFTSRRVNDGVGMVLSALLGTRLHMGRRVHFKHHRLVGTPGDPNEIWHSTRRIPPGRPALRHFLWQLVGGRLVLLVGGLVAGLRRGAAPARPGPDEAPGKSSRQDRADLLTLFVTQGTILALMALLAHPAVYLFLYLLPLVTLTALFEALRSFSEHVLTEKARGVPAEKFRLFFMNATGLECFFISQFHFNYHHLHHLYPNVVTFKLKALHRWLARHDPAYGSKYLERPGYVRVAGCYLMNREIPVVGHTRPAKEAA